MYRTYYIADQSENLTLDEVFYMIKNYYLIEIVLDNDLCIRQWNDLDTQLLLNWETIDMKAWKVYLTDGNNLLDVWNWRGTDELEKWIEKCNNIEYDRSNFYS